MTYNEFLHSKMAIAEKSGFEVQDSEIHPALKPHQRAAVRWALEGGRRALFESFGLGKTIQELEWCRQVIKHKGGLMTVPMMAVKMGRYGIGIELNPDYFRDGLGYLKQEELIRDEPTLFDFVG